MNDMLPNLSGNIDNEPVILVTDKDDYVIQVGHPSVANKTEMGKYALKGYSIRHMTLGEYKAMKLKWIYDKPQTPTP